MMKTFKKAMYYINLKEIIVQEDLETVAGEAIDGLPLLCFWVENNLFRMSISS